MSKIKIIILILSLFTLMSCEHKTAPVSLTVPETFIYEPNTTKETEKKTESDAQKEEEKLIKDGLERTLEILKEKENLTQTITTEITFYYNGISLWESTEKTAVFCNLLTDETTADITITKQTSDVSSTKTEHFEDQTLTSSLPAEFSETFTEYISKEEFLKKHDPYIFPNQKYYETVEINENSIIFSNANRFESWIELSGYSLVNATAVVCLADDGCIQSIEYSATAYKAVVCAEIKVNITYKSA